MKQSRIPKTAATRRQGMAIVIVLAMVVLLTFAVMAFFSRATANRGIEVSRANKVKVDQALKSGTDHATARLLSEIVAGSTRLGADGTPSNSNPPFVYRPTSRAGMIPKREISAAIPASDPRFRNLLRQSVAAADPDASGDNSGVVTGRGRAVSTDRWNQPRLLAGAGFTSDDQLPRWVYLSANGTAGGDATVESVARFAYNIYNVGGCFDVNVVGAPPGLSATEAAMIKPTQAGAVLGGLSGFDDPAALVSWRAPGGFSSEKFREAMASGFLSPGAGGRRIETRGDLIRLVRSGELEVGEEALPLLVHFQRSLNAPSWRPSTPAGSALDYDAQADNPAAPNRFAPNVRVSVAFDRGDGSKAMAGDPLLTRRFALSRIMALGTSGVNPAGRTMREGRMVPATAATVQKDFGLAWNFSTARWDYVGANGNTVLSAIQTLNQVAAEGREPDFFETLKAAILSGSLGRSGGNANSFTSDFDSLPDYQIIQIGCNLIDQYRVGDLPMTVTFDPSRALPFCGVVDLPYINKIGRIIYRVPEGESTVFGTQPAYRPYVGAWFAPEFWKPHLRSQLSEVGPSAPRVRFRAQNGDMSYLEIQFTTNHTSFPGQEFSYSGFPGDGRPGSTGKTVFGASSWVSVENLEAFRDVPRFGTPSVNATSGQSRGAISDPGGFGTLFGIEAGAYNCPDTRIPGTPPQEGGVRPQWVLTAATIVTDPLVTFFLEYEHSPNDWRSFDYVKNFDNTAPTPNARFNLGFDGVAGDNNGVVNAEADFYNLSYLPGNFGVPLRTLTGAIPASAALRADPRGDRFGTSNGYAIQPGFNRRAFQTSGSYSYQDPTSLPRPPFVSSLIGYSGADGARARLVPGTSKILGGSGWTPALGDGWGNFPFALGDNLDSSPLRYKDNDGVARSAAGAYRSFLHDDAAMRPVMLNRRFTSPGDLGFVHRGEPWKDLDFFTPDSADAGLLEFFSVEEEPVVVAGRIHLNSAPPDVLAALLQDALLDEAASSRPALSQTQAAALAEAIHQSITSRPWESLADIVNEFSDDTALATLPEKRRREVVARILSGVGQTRTWNVLLDVIAQTGRFSPAIDVTGESRAWVHLAIDRFTGRVIARQTEPIHP